MKCCWCVVCCCLVGCGGVLRCVLLCFVVVVCDVFCCCCVRCGGVGHVLQLGVAGQFPPTRIPEVDVVTQPNFDCNFNFNVDLGLEITEMAHFWSTTLT